MLRLLIPLSFGASHEDQSKQPTPSNSICHTNIIILCMDNDCIISCLPFPRALSWCVCVCVCVCVSGGPIHLFNKNFFFSWPRCVACGILVPQPGIKPVPPAVEVQSLNHWTTREVPQQTLSDSDAVPIFKELPA